MIWSSEEGGFFGVLKNGSFSPLVHQNQRLLSCSWEKERLGSSSYSFLLPHELKENILEKKHS